MVTAVNLQVSRFQFFQDVASGRWTWTTAIDLSGIAPVYLIEGITTPFGVLRDSIPIPGDVVVAMGESISAVQNQYSPNILVGPPSSLTFIVDEGFGFSEPQSGLVSNNGTFGSLLNAILTTSASYVTTEPSQLGNLSSSEGGTFEVAVDSTTLLAANSPYSETVIFTDGAAVNTPQTLPVTITVRPKATITVTPSSLDFTVIKPLVGDFPAIPTQTFDVENTGPAGSVLEWQLQQVGAQTWLSDLSPISGTLNSGESETITVTVVPLSSTLKGTFNETLRVSGYSTNLTADVGLELVIT